jgi:hypothetical protein
LNGDGWPDVAWAEAAGSGSYAVKVYDGTSGGEDLPCPDYVHHGQGDGSFTLAQELCNAGEVEGGTADMDLADLNDDGRLNVVALRGGDLFYLGQSDGSFQVVQPAFTPPVFGAARVTLGDVDGDEVPDALVRDSACCNTATQVYFGSVLSP